MIECMTVGDMIPTNAFFYIDDETSHGFLIDAGSDGELLAEHAEMHGWTIERLLLTHCHFDHIGGAEDFSIRTGAPIYAAEDSPRYYSDPNWNLSLWGGGRITLSDVTTFADREVITLAANPTCSLEVRYTPGHTTDSCIFYSARDGVAFVGDTIFLASIGRTDFPGGDEQTLWDSIAREVFTLPPETVLYSGHTEPTTVGAEMARYRR